MKITIAVTEAFKRYLDGHNEIVLDVPAETTAMAAVISAGIPEGEVGFITVNGVKAYGSHGVKDGDRLKVYIMFIGG